MALTLFLLIGYSSNFGVGKAFDIQKRSVETVWYPTAIRRDASKVSYESAKCDEDLRCNCLSKCQQRDYNCQCPFVCCMT